MPVCPLRQRAGIFLATWCCQGFIGVAVSGAGDWYYLQLGGDGVQERGDAVLLLGRKGWRAGREGPTY